MGLGLASKRNWYPGSAAGSAEATRAVEMSTSERSRSTTSWAAAVLVERGHGRRHRGDGHGLEQLGRATLEGHREAMRADPYVSEPGAFGQRLQLIASGQAPRPVAIRGFLAGAQHLADHHGQG